MYSLHKTVQLVVVACFVSTVYTETPIKSIITGYGTSSVRACWHCYLLTVLGYASSSNTLSTGAQGSEHSATFADPGDCATNDAVYPIGTKIYVVVGARLMKNFSTLHTPVFTTALLSIADTAPYTSSIHMQISSPIIRDFKSTSQSKTPAATALPNHSRTSTSGWAYPVTLTKPNSQPAPMGSQSHQIPLRP